MSKNLVFIILILGVVLSACASPPEATSTELIKVRLPMGYIPSVQYAPFYVAAERGYFKEAGFEVEFDYKFETDGVALVGAGELPFALVSGEQVLLARAQGLPVVYVMSWWKDYPVAVSAEKKSGIVEPADLKGKKIGIPGLFGASYVGFRALLNAAGLEESDVTLDSIGFNQVEALVSGQEDAVVVYANNEPIQLESLGYEINTLLVRDYAYLASNGIISNEKLIAENPELVQRFVQAVIKGLDDTIREPSEAFEVSRKYVEGLAQADQLVQWQILNTSIDFWRAKKLGYSDPLAWANMQEVLLDMGLLKQPLELEKAFTNQFIE